MSYDEPIEEDDKLVKKISKKKIKMSVMERMLSPELEKIYSFDEEGNVIMDEKTGKPLITPEKLRYQEIEKMHTIQTQYPDKDVRKRLFKGFKKMMDRKLKKKKISEEEHETELEKAKHLFRTGYFPGYEGQNIHKLYHEEILGDTDDKTKELDK